MARRGARRDVDLENSPIGELHVHDRPGGVRERLHRWQWQALLGDRLHRHRYPCIRLWLLLLHRAGFYDVDGSLEVPRQHTTSALVEQSLWGSPATRVSSLEVELELDPNPSVLQAASSNANANETPLDAVDATTLQ